MQVSRSKVLQPARNHARCASYVARSYDSYTCNRGIRWIQSSRISSGRQHVSAPAHLTLRCACRARPLVVKVQSMSISDEYASRYAMNGTLAQAMDASKCTSHNRLYDNNMFLQDSAFSVLSMQAGFALLEAASRAPGLLSFWGEGRSKWIGVLSC